MPDLAEQLRAYTDALVPPTPPVRRSRPRRAPWLVAAAAVVVALVALAVSVGGDEEDESFVNVGPGRSPRVAAVDGEGRLAVFDLATGERRSTLTDEDAGGPISYLAPAADGRALYFTRRVGECDTRIERVDLESGRITIPVPPERPGTPLAMALAGEKLAYSTMSCGGDAAELVITAADGAASTDRIPLVVEGGIALSPDGSLVAYVVDGGVEVLDPLYGTTVVLDAGECGASAPAFRPDGGLLVVTCDTVALFDPFSGERVGDAPATDDVLFPTFDGAARWDGRSLVPVPFLDGERRAVVLPDEPVEPPPVPFGAEIGPGLDPSALDLPDTGLALQLDMRDMVVFVDLDGTVLGHLDGFTLSPGPWSNPPLRGAGPLVLGRGDEAMVLDGGRLVPVPGGPGAVPLADGAVLEPGVLRLASGAQVDVSGGEVVVSSDRGWVSVADVAHRSADGSPVRLDPGCAVTDVMADGALVRVCDDDVWIGDKVVRAGGPFADPTNGHWTSALVSPGVNELLLQHSGDCESASGWRAPIGEGTFRALGPSGDAWDGGGLGWLEDGRALVSFGPGICGAVFPGGPGVYVEERDGSVTPLYVRPGGVTYLGAVLWRQAPA